MSARQVLREHRSSSDPKPIYAGDEVFLSLPSAPQTGEVGCQVNTPDGEKVSVVTRRREFDVCAVFTPAAEGRYGFSFALPNGKRTTDGFIVYGKDAKRSRAKGSRKGNR